MQQKDKAFAGYTMRKKMWNYNQELLDIMPRANSIYDFFALVICYLLKMGKRSSDYSEEEWEEDADGITLLVEIFFDKFGNISGARRLKQLCSDVRQFLTEYVENDRIFCLLCMKLVCAIDDNLIVSDWDAGFVRSSECNDYYEYKFLNDSYSDTIGILPIRNDVFVNSISEKFYNENGQALFRDKKDGQDLCISDIVNNFLVFDQKSEEPLKPCRTYYFPKKYFTGKHFAEAQQLKIGIAPMIFHNVKDICKIKWKDSAFHNGTGSFEIHGFQYDFEEELKKRYRAVVQRAKKEEIDFLVFPELMVAPQFLEDLKGKLPLIINGSYWADNQNCSCVSDSTSHVICKYLKKVAFELEENGKAYRENLEDNISDSQGRYVILDFEGFARIGVCICRDMDNSGQRLFHKRVQEDIVFVPSFSKSTDMRRAAMELAGNHQMLVVIANSCSALWGEERTIEQYCQEGQVIGYIAAPGKKKNQRGAVLHNYCMDGTICNKCGTQSMSCCNVVTVDMMDYTQVEDIWTLDIRQSFPEKIETDFG